MNTNYTFKNAGHGKCDFFSYLRDKSVIIYVYYGIFYLKLQSSICEQQ